MQHTTANRTHGNYKLEGPCGAQHAIEHSMTLVQPSLQHSRSCLSGMYKHSSRSHAIFIITMEQRREVRTSLQCSTTGVESIKKSASNAHARAMSHLVMQMRSRCADETITALEALELLLKCY